MTRTKSIGRLLLEPYDKIDPIESEILLAHALNEPREYIIAYSNDKISNFKVLKFKSLIKKRARGVPVAYLTGHKEFYGLEFLVNKHTLIPRPDTEILVEAAIDKLQPAPTRTSGTSDFRLRTTLIDIGTGTGCIPISIVKSLQVRRFAGWQVFATDISRRALKVAKRNAKRHGVDIKFLHGNLLEPFIKTCKPANLKTCKLIITANLPYLTEAQYQFESSIHKEPKSALVAEKHGLALYEELLKQIQTLLTIYDLRLTCFLEIDPSQTKLITVLIQNILPGANIEIKKDLAGRDRVVILGMKTAT